MSEVEPLPTTMPSSAHSWNRAMSAMRPVANMSGYLLSEPASAATTACTAGRAEKGVSFDASLTTSGPIPSFPGT